MCQLFVICFRFKQMARDEYDLNFILRFQRDVQWIFDFQLHKQLIARDV